jgi:hypothetical protein
MIDLYSGDPALRLTPDGADFDYRGGQPVMDQGLENCALLSLLVEKDWPGNIFLEPEERVGSDYLEKCRQTITLAHLADIDDAAERALATTKAFGTISSNASSPSVNRIENEIALGSGGSLSLQRERGLWRAQAMNPASRRLS